MSTEIRQVPQFYFYCSACVKAGPRRYSNSEAREDARKHDRAKHTDTRQSRPAHDPA